MAVAVRELIADTWHLQSWREREDQARSDVFIVNRFGGSHAGNIVTAESLLGKQEASVDADGVIIKRGDRGTYGVGTADCLPLVLANDAWAAVLHISRKTLVHGILDRFSDLVDPTTAEYIHAGPAICRDHFVFEWEGDDIKAFAEKFPSAVTRSDQGTHLSLAAAVNSYFADWGLSLSDRDARCTLEHRQLPSYERDRLRGQPFRERLSTVVRAATNR